MSLREFVLLSLAYFVCSKPMHGLSQGCPEAMTLSPCTCTDDGLFGSSVSCDERVETAHQLKQIFFSASGRIFREVTIENVSLANIPAEVFETSEVQSLFVNSSSLIDLFNRSPKFEYSLQTLTLTSVEIQNGLDFKQMDEVKVLHTFTLSDTQVPLIGDDFRDNVSPELTFLAFEKTGTQAVSPGAFSRLTKLSTLAIVETEITTLSRNVLPYPSQIQNLFLNYNKLSSLPSDIFSGMPNLKALLLVGNEFSTVDSATFAPVWSTLEYIGVDVNPIRCDCGLRWLASTDDKKKVRGTCASPSGFLGRNLQDLEAENFEHCEDLE